MLWRIINTVCHVSKGVVMSARRVNGNEFETGIDNVVDNIDLILDSPTTKLERRRRIEDLFEEKRLREELGEFDLL